MTLSEYFDKDIADVWAEIKASHDSNEVLKLRAKLGNLERHRDYYRAKEKYLGMLQWWWIGPVCKTGASGLEGSNPSIPTNPFCKGALIETMKLS